MADITGTSGSDYLDGTNEDDIINAGEGDDVINGSGGSDVIDGGNTGYNQIDYDGNSADYTFTRHDNGTVTVQKPNGGEDTLSNIDGFWFKGENAWKSLDDLAPNNAQSSNNNTTSTATDTSNTETNNTSSTNNTGNTSNTGTSTQSASNNNSSINGTASGDYLSGTSGNDVINAGAGVDVINGSAGNDTINGGDAGYNQVDYAGNSADYTFTRNDDGTVTVQKPGGGEDTLSNIGGFWFAGEGVWKSLDDVVPATRADDGASNDEGSTINGTAGNDYLSGTSGNDVINAGAGVDVISGSNGSDTINGGDAGYNQVDYAGNSTDYKFSQNDDGTIRVEKPGDGVDTLSNIGGIWFQGDRVWRPINELVDFDGRTINGTAGNDVIDGTHGDDTINAGAGVDIIRGSAGNDVIDGGDDGYNQVDYDGHSHEYSFSDNGDGRIRVEKPDGNFDLLSNIHGIWFECDGVWKPIDELLTPQVNNSTAAIGDRVWLDSNGNGLQDELETGVSDVTVHLKDASGTILATTTTDANGNYLFDGLAAGQYSVQVVAPNGSWFTGQNAGSDHADSDVNVNTGMTDLITLAEGERNITVDAGIETAPVDQHNACLGDRVFLDANANGQQDAGETGVSGVTVNLLNSSGQVIDTTTTDANGDYLFHNLAGGTYQVQVIAPNNMWFTTQNQGNDATDSDVNASGLTAPITLAAGEQNLTVDAGLETRPVNQNTAVIRDTVFIDETPNGIEFSLEAKAPNVTVNLLNGSGQVIATTVTDANGFYEFDNLAAGNYAIQVVAPNGFTFTTQDVLNNTEDNRDSDVDVNTGISDTFALATGEVVNNVTAGLVQNNAVIRDTVFIDETPNGIEFSLEAKAPGVTVNLLNGSGQIIGTTVTDANGFYEFNNLMAGNYAIQVVAPNGFKFTTQDALNNTEDERDSDVDVNTGISDTFALAAGEIVRDVTAGLVQNNAVIRDTVFIDETPNGIEFSLEAKAPGVTVNLLNGSGNVIATTVTDANGFYEFNNLTAGNYAIQVVAPNGFTFTTQDALNNSEDERDSDVDVNTGISDTFALAAGEIVRDVTAGLVQNNAVIRDTVFFDETPNGIEFSGEAKASGVTVNLLNGSGQVIGTTVTDANGLYEFNNLMAGNYAIQVVAPDGFTFTTQDALNNTEDHRDSDVDVNTGISDTFALAAGEIVRDVTAGLVPADTCDASLGNFVWHDTNKNGIQDAGEQGVEGVTVNLKDASGKVIDTDVTSSNGYYKFENLHSGDYSVGFVKPDNYGFTTANRGSSDGADSDANVNTGMSQTVHLNIGEYNRTVDAGLVLTDTGDASLGNFVWHDTNKNGIQDAGEQGVEGVTVNLKDASGKVIDTDVTSSNGYYKFENLHSGDYSVGFVKPDNYGFTTANRGSSDGADSDANVNTGMSQTVHLNIGEYNRTVDAGLVLTDTGDASLGNFVWHDTNKNGIQDAGEQGVGGVTVNLKDASGKVIDTDVTSSNGYYKFENLHSGDYSVGFVKPDNYGFTTANRGSSDGADSDANVNTGMSQTVHLNIGEYNRTVDAGLVSTTSSTSDYVTVCEDHRETFNVLSNDEGNGLKLVGVSHENSSLDSQFASRGGQLSFTANGNVSYKGMSNYYGKDKLIYTFEDAYGTRYTETVNVDVKPVSDVGRSTVHSPYDEAHHGDSSQPNSFSAHNASRVIGTDFFGTYDDSLDAKQSFGNYNNGVADDRDHLVAIKVTGYDGSGYFTVNGGRVSAGSIIQWSDIQAGNFRYHSTNEGTQQMRFHFQPIDSGTTDGHCGGSVIGHGDNWVVYTPIALDLNGDGRIGVTGHTSSYQKDSDAEIGRTVEFDIDADGDLDTIEWFDGSGDGILVNANFIGENGEIDGRALFGDEGGKYANGYEKLALLDTDGDGQISGAELASLQLWVDDGDAVLEEGELQTLDENQIAAISTELNIARDSEGRELIQSTATKTDGSTLLTEDAFFASEEGIEEIIIADEMRNELDMETQICEDCIAA